MFVGAELLYKKEEQHFCQFYFAQVLLFCGPPYVCRIKRTNWNPNSLHSCCSLSILSYNRHFLQRRICSLYMRVHGDFKLGRNLWTKDKRPAIGTQHCRILCCQTLKNNNSIIFCEYHGNWNRAMVTCKGICCWKCWFFQHIRRLLKSARMVRFRTITKIFSWDIFKPNKLLYHILLNT